MQWLEIIALGVSLSFDAMTVAIGIGLCHRNLQRKEAMLIASFFGAFQGVMTFSGYLLGRGMRALIQPVDHWIAFFLLLYVGGKMLYEAYQNHSKGPECPTHPEELLKPGRLLILSVATSIDAMAAGLTLAVSRQGSILVSCVVIALITYALSLAGALLANRFSSNLQYRASVAGGLILIAIGVKTLVEHISQGV